MLNLTSVYHENLRDCSTEELMTRLECYQLDRLEMLDEPETDRTASTIDYLEDRQNVMLEELTRRKRLISRFPDDARRPHWPDRSSARHQQQVALAAELKRLWPIDRFSTELMAARITATGQDRWKAHCPFPDHEDRTPSFTIYLRDNKAWCHGCNRGGDIFDLTAIYFGLPHFSDALRKLSDATIVDVERKSA